MASALRALTALCALVMVSAATLKTRTAIVDRACSGEIEASFERLLALRSSDIKNDAAMLHVQSAFEYILNADNVKAVSLHKAGKAVDGKQIPPLAEFYLKGQSCTGLSDIFYLSAVNIKKLVDTDLSVEHQMDGHSTLITLLSDTGLSRAAEKHMQAALVLKPDDPSLLFHSVLMTPVVYESREHVLEARALLEARMRNLSQVEDITLSSLDDFSLPPSFYLVYQGFNDKDFLTELYRNYIRAYKALDDTAAVSFTGSVAGAPAVPGARAQIRMGFVSSHIRRHSVCKLFCGLIEQLNLGKDDFRIYVFSTAPESKEDSHTERLRDNCNKVTTLGPRGVVSKIETNRESSDDEAGLIEFVRMEKSVISNRDSVRSRDIDILIFLDIGMDPANLMWAATRLAPVQIVTWGHPSTTGLPHVDYFVSSELFYQMTNTYIAPVQDSGQQRFDVVTSGHYSEQLLLLTSLGIFFERPSLQGPNKQEFRADDLIQQPLSFLEALKRRHAGNADVVKVLDIKISAAKSSSPTKIILCPQQLPKFHPNFDDFIRESLKVNADSIFVVIHDPQSKYQWQRTVKQRWYKSVDGLETDGRLTDRILWLGRLDPQEYLTIVAVGDIMVDPYPFGGGVTTLEALAMCTPVITFPLQTVPALTAGMLTNLFRTTGDDVVSDVLSLLIVKSQHDLVSNVDHILSSESGLLKQIRERICSNLDNIFQQKTAPEEWAVMIKNLVQQGALNRL